MTTTTRTIREAITAAGDWVDINESLRQGGEPLSWEMAALDSWRATHRNEPVAGEPIRLDGAVRRRVVAGGRRWGRTLASQNALRDWLNHELTRFEILTTHSVHWRWTCSPNNWEYHIQVSPDGNPLWHTLMFITRELLVNEQTDIQQIMSWIAEVRPNDTFHMQEVSRSERRTVRLPDWMHIRVEQNLGDETYISVEDRTGAWVRLGTTREIECHVEPHWVDASGAVREFLPPARTLTLGGSAHNTLLAAINSHNVLTYGDSSELWGATLTEEQLRDASFGLAIHVDRAVGRSRTVVGNYELTPDGLRYLGDTWDVSPTAEARAEELLCENLSPEQLQEWRDNPFIRADDGTEVRQFVVKSQYGNRYRIYERRDYNVCLENQFKCIVHSYCLQPQDHTIPLADQLLSQKLLLEANEDYFLATANVK